MCVWYLQSIISMLVYMYFFYVCIYLFVLYNDKIVCYVLYIIV